MFGEHAEDDAIVGFGGGEGFTESGAHVVFRPAAAGGAVDFEDEALAAGLADAGKHSGAVIFVEVLLAGDAGTAEVVEAGHVEVEVPVLGLGEVDDFGDMGGEAGADAGIAEDFEAFGDFGGFAGLVEAVGEGAVEIDAEGFGGGNIAGIGAKITEFGGSLGDPVEFSAFVAVLAEETKDVAIAAGLPDVDAFLFTLGEHFLDVGGGEVVSHLLIERGGEVGVAGDGVSADHEAGNGGLTEPGLREEEGSGSEIGRASCRERG